MNNPNKASQTRMVVAVSLFAAAIISAMALTALGNQSETFWVARKNLSPGVQITDSDLAQVKVALGASSSDYFSKDSELIGTYVMRPIGKAELVPISAISDLPGEMRSEHVPISVRGSDIPSDIELGESVNIYWVPQAMGMEKLLSPALVTSGAYLRSIDRKSANFGTEVALTISVFSQEIVKLLSATATGRLVLVRSNG